MRNGRLITTHSRLTANGTALQSPRLLSAKDQKVTIYVDPLDPKNSACFLR